MTIGTTPFVRTYVHLLTGWIFHCHVRFQRGFADRKSRVSDPLIPRVSDPWKLKIHPDGSKEKRIYDP